jgi:cell division GTPase FtsZ
MEIIFGQSLMKISDEIHVTVIATGFLKEDAIQLTHTTHAGYG